MGKYTSEFIIFYFSHHYMKLLVNALFLHMKKRKNDGRSTTGNHVLGCILYLGIQFYV